MSEPQETIAPKRRDHLMTVDEALDHVTNGATVGIGGFINASHPMLLVRGLIRRGFKNLIVVGAASAGLEIDLLIASGCVAKVVTPYISGEALAPIGPAFRAAAEKGLLEVFELDEAMHYAGLRAAAQRVPFNPWVSGLGTSYPMINPAIKQFNDPITGAPLLAIPAINLDVAFLHAAQSDVYGNVQHVGHGFGDRALYAAADVTIVQVEKIVSNEEIKADPMRTAFPGAQGIVRATYGSHPYSSPGFYREDREHIAEYVKAATAWAKADDFKPLQAYLDRYIYGPETYEDYLELIGIKTLLSLYEY